MRTRPTAASGHRVGVDSQIDFAMLLRSVLDCLKRVEGPRGGWHTARCCFHDDEHPSLRLNEHGYKCMSCEKSGSLVALAKHLGVLGERAATNEETYDYVDEGGALIFQVVRRPGKRFLQRRPVGDDWEWNTKSVRRVIYRLPEVLSTPIDEALFVVEGEKDTDRLWAEGVPATTNAEGAGKWRPEYNEYFRDRAVIIIPDNDEAGRKHVQDVVEALRGVAADIRVLELAGLPARGDASDWFNQGGTRDGLLALAQSAPPAEPPAAPHCPTDAEEDFRRTDAGNGELFARLYGDRVRYDHRRRHWLLWSGHYWTPDCDGEIRRLAKTAARHRYVTAPSIDDLQARSAVAKFAIQSENRQRLEAMITQAQSEPPIADAGTSWNADAWLLGVANGVVDLRDGQLRAGLATDKITLHVPVLFGADAACPRWLQFLDEVFRGDEELIDFIHRAVGYSLTGITTEQCLFLCYGKGSNGKSILLSILRALAGEYAYNAPFSLFEMQGRGAIPNDVAALVGKRLVSSSETNEGSRLNEARLKALTGCDPITARFLHSEFFTFDPVAKYWLAVNHKPKVGDDSHGFWRRVRLIPFTRQFDQGKDADDGLLASLLAELAGIVAWAVRGAGEWQARGLPPPAAVLSATETYRTESDPIAQFIDECCITGEGFSTPATQTFKAYKAWCAEQAMSERDMLGSTAFGTRMSGKFEKRHVRRGNVYDGVGLLSEHEDAPEVKGWVKGLEASVDETEVFPLENSLTRENPENAFTTLHPSPEAADRPLGKCRQCPRLAAGRTDFGTPVCGMHAAQTQQLERKFGHATR